MCRRIISRRFEDWWRGCGGLDEGRELNIGGCVDMVCCIGGLDLCFRYPDGDPLLNTDELT